MGCQELDDASVLPIMGLYCPISMQGLNNNNNLFFCSMLVIILAAVPRAVSTAFRGEMRVGGCGVGKRVIAIIDDEPDVSGFLTELLGDEGYEPISWPRGAGAYAFVKRNHPSAVLLDMNMETHDAGLRVAEELRADPGTRGIPIIIVSAAHESLRKQRQRLGELGCSVHGKPVDIPALLALLSMVIDGRRAALVGR